MRRDSCAVTRGNQWQVTNPNELHLERETNLCVACKTLRVQRQNVSILLAVVYTRIDNNGYWLIPSFSYSHLWIVFPCQLISSVLHGITHECPQVTAFSLCLPTVQIQWRSLFLSIAGEFLAHRLKGTEFSNRRFHQSQASTTSSILFPTITWPCLFQSSQQSSSTTKFRHWLTHRSSAEVDIVLLFLIVGTELRSPKPMWFMIAWWCSMCGAIFCRVTLQPWLEVDANNAPHKCAIRCWVKMMVKMLHWWQPRPFPCSHTHQIMMEECAKWSLQPGICHQSLGKALITLHEENTGASSTCHRWMATRPSRYARSWHEV